MLVYQQDGDVSKIIKIQPKTNLHLKAQTVSFWNFRYPLSHFPYRFLYKFSVIYVCIFLCLSGEATL